MVPPPPLTVLIVSGDATAAALLGGLVETLGYTVRFAPVAEGGDASLRRVRPRIYMIDCGTTSLCSDDVIGRAAMRGVSVVLLGPRGLVGRMRDLATRHDIEFVETPPDPEPLSDALDRAGRKSG